jgi:pimeloyl-ACP methyl ester carboxylesterase
VEFVSADRVAIDYDVWGEGAPVLLIHGFASNARVNWVNTGWVKTLNQAKYQAITFDNRGHGRSSKLYDPAQYSVASMAEDAKRLIMHLGHARAAVIGYSMGARIAASLTLKNPAFVSAVVFAGLAANMIRGLDDTEGIARALEAGSIDDVADPTRRSFRAFAEQTGSDLKALAACMRSSRDPISVEDLRSIQVPVLVVAGSEDVTAGAVDPLVKAMPNASGLVLPGKDHMKAVGDRTFKNAVVKFFDLLNLRS